MRGKTPQYTPIALLLKIRGKTPRFIMVAIEHRNTLRTNEEKDAD